MKKIVAILMAMIMVISVTVVLAGSAADNDTKTKEPVIIGFESTPGPKDKAIVRGHGGDIKYSYTIINAIAAKLPEPAIENIQRNPRVTYVEMDGEVHTLDDELNSSWGVKRIGAGTVHDSGNTGSEVTVAILDTGIDYNHPDLNDNYKGGYDFVNDDSYPMDDNGHGTHCAGIVAAKDDGEGVVGVAPEAHLYAVKVLNSGGSGYLSDVVKGIEWSVNNSMDVISMSLGSDTDYQALHDACDAAYAADIVVVASAGNSGNPRGRGDNVGYPARYDSVIAVAATDNEDVRARWSSTGPDVELAAPGVSIYSTYKGGEYVYMDGTSMACPHVAGTAALVIYSGITDNGDVRAHLWDTAEDLGATGRDTWYGFGLVDAEAAAGSAVTLELIVVTSETATIPKGLTLQYTATGTYSDDSTADITSSVTWASSATAVATIDSAGLATGVGEGNTDITAALGGMVSDTAALTVTAPILQSITVMPDTATIEVGASQQYTATGTYSDASTVNITSSVTWASSDTAVATIDLAGLATGVSDGSTDITATLGGFVSDTAALTVTLALNSIAVTPETATIPKGLTQQYTATGTYSDASTADITSSVTWESSNTAVATIDSAGLATGVSEGSIDITATLGLVSSDGVKLSVTAPSEPTAVIVKSISYSTEGGRNQDKHLCIAVALVDNLGNSVADASVSIDVSHDESLYVSYTGTTGTDGTVTFQANNAPSGDYTTTVTAVIAEGLIWDEVTPENSFPK